MPVAVGRHSTRNKCGSWRYADAAVVGSAIVAEIERLSSSPRLPGAIGEFARGLLGNRTAQ